MVVLFDHYILRDKRSIKTRKYHNGGQIYLKEIISNTSLNQIVIDSRFILLFIYLFFSNEIGKSQSKVPLFIYLIFSNEIGESQSKAQSDLEGKQSKQHLVKP